MKKYYPEIDGLRAIAVLFVLIFHLNPEGIFSGGYIGVDIFFVISGYLITGIIYKDINNQQFKFTDFMNRRIARLYPALLFTIFFVIVGGFLIYATDYYLTTLKTIKYVFFSASNIMFMRSKGYWDASSNENPLLHTWSLGVEQQFYICFPLILFIFAKVFKTKYTIIITTIIFSIFSFICAQYLSQKIPSTNFYFTFSRFFELGIGGIFAIKRDSLKNIKNSHKEILFIIGFSILSLCAIFYETSINYYPGLNTLLVILGSLLCILYGDAKYTGMILRQKLIVYIGTISYSIYLIHWPLIVFYRYLSQKNHITNIEQLILLFITVLFAIFIFKFIENKYRKISISIFKPSGKVFSALFILLITLNLTLIRTEGFPKRLIVYTEDIVKKSIYAGSLPEYTKWNNNVQLLGSKNQPPIAIFVGDSFLGQFVEQIDLYYKSKNQSVLIIGEYNCLMMNNINKTKSSSCIEATNKLYNVLTFNLPIIRISNWSSYKEHSINKQFYDNQLNTKKVRFEEIWNETLNQQKINRNKMLFILSHPKIDHSVHINGNAPLFYLINNNNEFIKIKYESDHSRITTHNQMIDLINNNTNLSYLEIYDLFCDKKFCYNAPKNKLDKYFYSYNDHLSRSGAKEMWDNIGDKVYQFILDNSSARK
ncbi:acyltransferase [Gilliamella sp. B14384H2]|uniref:acyltransferase family protein n=1 Tax=unclassified Gilliamella TaxID=2685620 RepID=UPI0018DD7146|nr:MULTISPECIES: acyltransferase family protein [unclassified Gilliamella]MBI0037842.1 acyltransferase [Gilliamella sp. B14384G10]MBI0039837.1 acyltransferase [Gilliamella sp. B14384G7]MBI0051677.1 acyltransferase [Gilliamella sp. B14384G13]MBI0054129.1 acyltransferase [Gilliamella sp. B14384H2]